MNEEASARAEIAALTAELSHLGDAGDIQALSRLFVETGVYTLQDGNSATGPSAIARMLTDFSKKMSEHRDSGPKYMRHHATTSHVDITSRHEAAGDIYFLNVSEKGLDHWGRWRDCYTRQETGRWRFAKREVIVEGTADTSWLNDRK